MHTPTKEEMVTSYITRSQFDRAFPDATPPTASPSEEEVRIAIKTIREEFEKMWAKLHKQAAKIDEQVIEIAALRQLLECVAVNLSKSMSKSIQKFQAKTIREELAAMKEQP
jgi:hypothetical protein